MQETRAYCGHPGLRRMVRGRADERTSRSATFDAIGPLLWRRRAVMERCQGG